ncbi:MAG TPA: GNAT family N-acetyltransferase [Candidatus Angelobacter sp.]|nr:GNAT family N-acetyltransferase [Candidatus Angelobacter sp.]
MLRIRIHTSPRELEQLRPLWTSVRTEGQGTIFQDFGWNLLAARKFSAREEPFVISAQASYGAAIIPAALRRCDRTLRLLGEEMFDYRGFLHTGDQEVLRCALATLAQTAAPLEVLAVRACDRNAVLDDLELLPFTAAPSVNRAQIPAEEFGARHNRLGRNLRRFQRQGFQVKVHTGENSSLVRTIYQKKAQYDPASLFHDPLRVEFMVEAGRLTPRRVEIFTLESGPELAAALVTFPEETIRRFYTCFFDARFARLSPAMTLIYEVTRQSLASGLDCDYMTGEQGYKLRLATSSMALYRVRATSDQLAAFSERTTALGRAG